MISQIYPVVFRLCVGLGLLVTSAFAQRALDPVPASFTISQQLDSPVALAYVGIHPSPTEDKMISYSVANRGNRGIRSMILQLTSGGVSEPIFLGLPLSPDVMGSAPFLPSGMSSHFLFIHRRSRFLNKPQAPEKLNDGLTLMADYVLFDDGSSWGPNSTGMAEHLLGIFEGQKRLVAETKKLLDAKDEAALRALIMTDGPPVDLRLVDSESQRSAGIRRGYGVGILALRSDLLGRGDLSGIPARIRDLEREVGIKSALNDNKKQISFSWGFGRPIAIIGFSVGGRSVAVDERFSADGDWLADLGIRMRNSSGKSLKALIGSMFFPETRGNGGMKVWSVRYGPVPGLNRPTVGDTDPLIPSNGSFEFKIFRERPGTMFLLKDHPGLEGISRAVVSIDQILFDDGTRWNGGQWQRQDPENPKLWISIKQ